MMALGRVAVLLHSLLLAAPSSAAPPPHPRRRRRRPPLRAFVLVGQSNMVGHGIASETDPSSGDEVNGTCRWLVDSVPSQYGMLRSEDGTWAERTDVWVAYNGQYYVNDTDPVINSSGNLTVGFGGDPGQSGQVGPELGFGWAVGDGLGGRDGVEAGAGRRGARALLVKIAWGGKSLAVDFRPPSSGGAVGPNYRAMVANVKTTLSNLTSIFPSHKGRVKLSGFAWHQGWNDGCDDNMTGEYEINLANLIRDVRTDLGVPDLPVSIGVSGMLGYGDHGRRDDIIRAQLAVANATRYPEFAGTVAAVETRAFAREPSPHSPSKFEYHWMNNCESYWLLGKAMGEAMIKMLEWSERKVSGLSARLANDGSEPFFKAVY